MYDQKNDLALATGDFNILGNPMCEEFQERLIQSSPKFEDCIPELNQEYEACLLKSLVTELTENSEIKFIVENQIR